MGGRCTLKPNAIEESTKLSSITGGKSEVTHTDEKLRAKSRLHTNARRELEQ
jgi:hypothetical protein